MNDFLSNESHHQNKQRHMGDRCSSKCSIVLFSVLLFIVLLLIVAGLVAILLITTDISQKTTTTTLIIPIATGKIPVFLIFFLFIPYEIRIFIHRMVEY